MYDVIVVGAGSAGATVAARLTERPQTNVLLLEAGPDWRAADAPPALLDPDPASIAFYPDDYKSFHWTGLSNRVTEQGRADTHYARGRGPGGSSTINWMFAVRPPLRQFDGWAEQGCTGWSGKEVLPSFMRLEHDLDFAALPHHGGDGPLPIARVPDDDWTGLDNALRAAATEYGHAWIDDHNDPDPIGVGPYPYNVRDGRRVSTNQAYLEPARARGNLTITCDALTDRVLFDDSGAARGVRYRHEGEWKVAETAVVILSAGAIHSPTILLRSGIGPADDLAGLDVPVVADLPVGRSLQDHPVAMLALEGDQPRASTSRRPTAAVLRASSGVDGAPEGDMFYLLMARTDASPYPNAFVATLQACRSRGFLQLSSKDPDAAPVIEERLLSDELDIVRLREAVRYQLELLAHPAFAPLAREVRLGPEGPPACEATPTEIQHWLLTSAGNGSHISCTCRMGADGDPDAVVDPDGKVHGIDNLHVVDVSIIPEVPWSNTNVPAIMIGEHLVARIAT